MVIFILPKPFLLRKPFGRSSGPSGNFIYLYLVGGLEHESYIFPIILGIFIFPTDFKSIIFQVGVGGSTTKQMVLVRSHDHPLGTREVGLFGHKQLPKMVMV